MVRTYFIPQAGLLLGALALDLAGGASLAAPEVGKVTFAKGVATAQIQGEQARFLGPNFPLFEGDVITTGAKSFTVFELADGTRMTLRPNTVLAVERFSQPDENVALRLFKGGLRALTGLIAKSNPKQYKLETPVATIGIRGTKFDARLCEQDCAEASARGARKPAPPSSPVVARVALLKGKLTALSPLGESRTLDRGGPIYEKDIIETAPAAFAVLAFRDETRVTLRASTRFQVEEYSPEAYAAAEERVLLRLFQGGLRTLTGLIAKKASKSFKVATPIATIGIRGTGFDLLCNGACAQASGSLTAFSPSPPEAECSSTASAPGGAAEDEGLFAHVWQGEIGLELDDCQYPVSANQTVLLKPGSEEPASLSEVPDFMQDEAPRPDEVDVDFDNFFATEDVKDAAGLYVAVRDGHIALITADEVLDIGGGEIGYVDPATGDVVRLGSTPLFFEVDPVPPPEDFNLELQSLLDFFGEDLEGSPGDEPLACTID